jgi:quercetin dioxygenase-like cupin family protein
MATVVTGRRLVKGAPVDGTGFEYESDGRLADLLSQRVSPLFSQPITGEWVVGLVTSARTGGAYERGLGIFPAGNAGPPEHIHPTYEEQFEVIQGEFVFRIDGTERRSKAGDKFVVPMQTAHTFRCVSGEGENGQGVGAVLVETHPAARTGEVIATLFGMAHEGLLTASGQPRLLHAMVIGSEYADDTVFTSPPPSVAIPVARLIAPIARALGYRSVDSKYQNPLFWRAHVEQP